MLSRLIYRTVSVFFFLLGILSWFAGFSVVQGAAPPPGLADLALGMAALVAGSMALRCASEAWRAGRYDPLYD
jgi:hypothetical protein